MFKSVFSKYFSASALIILFSLVLFAAVQVLFTRQHWIDEKHVLLSEHVENVAAFVSDSTLEDQEGNYYIPEAISPLLKRLGASVDSSTLVTDTTFRILVCSDSETCPHMGKVLPSSVHSGLQRGPFFAVTHLGNLYKENQYCAGIKLYSISGDHIGYVLVMSSAHALVEYIWDNIRAFLLSGVSVLLFAFIVSYLFTYRMVKPLRQMAAATRQFSRGDFSARIAANGQDEVAELANAFNGMALSLSSLENMRRSFIANVSHDLRTPMTTISGFIDGILDGTIPPEKHKDYLKIVSDETKRLSRLVRSMLDLSRIDSGQIKITPAHFDLSALLFNTLLLFEERIEQKNISVEGIDQCSPLFVTADYDLLQQVMYNLVDNAVKFTQDGGTISFATIKHHGTAGYCIRNTGTGIPAEELPHIFERFYKSDRSRGLDKTGTGLGLYIVKSLINAHDGKITVSSRENEYCEFSFQIPDSISAEK